MFVFGFIFSVTDETGQSFAGAWGFAAAIGAVLGLSYGLLGILYDRTPYNPEDDR